MKGAGDLEPLVPPSLFLLDDFFSRLPGLLSLGTVGGRVS